MTRTTTIRHAADFGVRAVLHRLVGRPSKTAGERCCNSSTPLLLESGTQPIENRDVQPSSLRWQPKGRSTRMIGQQIGKLLLPALPPRSKCMQACSSGKEISNQRKADQHTSSGSSGWVGGPAAPGTHWLLAAVCMLSWTAGPALAQSLVELAKPQEGRSMRPLPPSEHLTEASHTAMEITHAWPPARRKSCWTRRVRAW